MKRREFIRLSIGTIAVANLPLMIGSSAMGANKAQEALPSQSPRRVELLDADWRFYREPRIHFTTALTNWVWTPGTADQAAVMTAPGLDTSGGTWKKTVPGDATLTPNTDGWYRAVLPEIAGPGRTVHFGSVDDNGTVYLNGQKLKTHNGFSDPFNVLLDSAWREGGPNVLTVLVQNIGGPGGIMKPVSIGQIKVQKGYSAPSYNDTGWRIVHLPHDYVVEGHFDPSVDSNRGALPVTPAWYRKHFVMPEADRGKSTWLYFEGIFADPKIYLNGKLIHVQPGGYDSFHVNIAPYVEYGKDNTLAIYVDPTNYEGWWYEGGGIYRHVWLNVADPVHIEPWGVYVTSDVTQAQGAASAVLTIQTDIVNEAAIAQPITLTTQIIGPDGKEAGTVESNHEMAPLSHLGASQTIDLPAALLWSLEERNLYHAVSTISMKGHTLDQHIQKFGVRTIRFDPSFGFFLNDKHVELQGVCNHQDFVGVGIGMPDSILHWRMKRLRDELNCNAIRCSHNAMSPAMYDACDELGLVVMDENRHPGDKPQAKIAVGDPYSNTHHVTSLVRRDRNHPSVIMWSMGNEEWAVQGDPYGGKIMTALVQAVHRYDTTRPVTAAVNEGSDNGWKVGFASAEDIVGVNYNYGSYDYLHQMYPQKMIFGSESGSDISCRGVYKRNNVTDHLSSYMTPENNWQPIATHPYVAGAFVWTGFDYRGETSPFGWPEISSNFGLLDMCGFPKDAAYYYKAWWNQDQPLVHIFPHWNWAGKEGQVVPIWCFSNCDRVELFVNGVSQGAQDMPLFRHVQWDNVIYQPGTLKVVGYRAGQNVAEKTVETTGAPAAVRLSADRSVLTADGEDTIPVAVAIVDAQGRVVPTADNLVLFSVQGAGTNAGVGNGDPSSHELNQANTRTAFNGLCMVLVKAAMQGGNVTLNASSAGLTGDGLKFRCV